LYHGGVGVPRAIKLVCTSWDQLGALLENDLRRGVCRVRLPRLPAIGADVKIDLGLPSGNSVTIGGQVKRHAAELDDPVRGQGVEVVITHFPPDALWLIEASLKAAREPQPMTVDRLEAGALGPDALDPLALDSASDLTHRPEPGGDTWNDAAVREFDPLPTDASKAPTGAALVEALRGEKIGLDAQSPFEQLGVRFDASDEDVRAAFHRAARRYSPDQLGRYDSDEAKALAGEIFMLLRDAFRKIGDGASREMTRALLRSGVRRPGEKIRSNPTPVPLLDSEPDSTPPTAVTPAASVRALSDAFPDPDTPPPDAAPPKPTGPFPVLATPIVPAGDITPEKVLSFRPSVRPKASEPPPRMTTQTDLSPPPPAMEDDPSTTPDGGLTLESLFGDLALGGDTVPPPMERGLLSTMIDPPSPEIMRGHALLDAGHFEEALQLYTEALKNRPRDREARAGKELAFGYRSLKDGDRLAASRHFEKALQMIPANERAAHALELTRRAQDQSGKGILERLLGKK
jgi:tetratricopeptide (TPR) repeat protein